MMDRARALRNTLAVIMPVGVGNVLTATALIAGNR
jgi:hypothetical protein